jgi:hypothetical protein
MNEKKVCNELADLTCANCTFSGTGVYAEEHYVECNPTQQALIQGNSVPDDWYCGEGSWTILVKKNGLDFKVATGLMEAKFSIENGGSDPWA